MQPTSAQIAAYESGKKTGENFDTLRAFWAAVSYGDADAPDFLSEPATVLGLFWEAGFRGENLPRWVRASRIGKLPAEGRSFNFRDQQFEVGVSVICIEGETRSDNHTFDTFNGGEKITVEGWLHHARGTDGEPLLIGAVQV